MEQTEAVIEQLPTRRQLIYEAAMCKRELNLVFTRLSAEQRERMHKQLLQIRMELQALRDSRQLALANRDKWWEETRGGQ
jgi:hypothetical protein